MGRKIVSYAMLAIVVISSGILQFGYHFCQEDGLHVLSHDCEHPQPNSLHPNQSSIRSCCSSLSEIDEDCCIKDFFFFINPLPEKIHSLGVPVPNSETWTTTNYEVDSSPNKILAGDYCCKINSKQKIPLNSLGFRRLLRSWVI